MKYTGTVVLILTVIYLGPGHSAWIGNDEITINGNVLYLLHFFYIYCTPYNSKLFILALLSLFCVFYTITISFLVLRTPTCVLHIKHLLLVYKMKKNRLFY